MDVKEFRRRGHETIDRIAQYYEELETFNVLPSVEPGFLSQLLPSDPPEDPEDFDQITADFNNKIMKGL